MAVVDDLPLFVTVLNRVKIRRLYETLMLYCSETIFVMQTLFSQIQSSPPSLPKPLISLTRTCLCLVTAKVIN
jgi:hypothetical protein